jgi:hypothetical protein
LWQWSCNKTLHLTIYKCLWATFWEPGRSVSADALQQCVCTSRVSLHWLHQRAHSKHSNSDYKAGMGQVLLRLVIKFKTRQSQYLIPFHSTSNIVAWSWNRAQSSFTQHRTTCLIEFRKACNRAWFIITTKDDKSIFTLQVSGVESFPNSVHEQLRSLRNTFRPDK